MEFIKNQSLLIFSIIVTVTLLYLLAPILTPFVLGAILAYLADPLVKRLEYVGAPHIVSVISIFLVVIGLLVIFVLTLMPYIEDQLLLLLDQIPMMINWLQTTILPMVKENMNVGSLASTLSNNLPKANAILATMMSSGHGMIEFIIKVMLTPVVTFYLLRDWDKILHHINKLLPKKYAPTIRTLAKQSDETLSAFLRGQLMIMLVLGIIYSVGLTIAGLQLGAIIGLIGGVLCIVPYLGSCFVIVSASIAGYVEYSTWQALIPIFIVFAIGQATEGYVLTPYLIGGRIGLHPVAVIFSVLAGGTLFGFFGVLLALPVAAVLMVIIRYYLRTSKG